MAKTTMVISYVEKYFPNLSDQQKEQLEQLPHLYKTWNEKINVISRKDIDEIIIRHLLHSLAISLFFDLNTNQKILDIGTGGGFPGIPLAIINPTAHFTLIDSIEKKINVVNAICSSINLKNCIGKHENAKHHKQKYNTVVSRAVTAFEPFLAYTQPLLQKQKESKILYLKGGNLDQELKKFRKKIKLFDLSEKLDEPFFETKKLVYYKP